MKIEDFRKDLKAGRELPENVSVSATELAILIEHAEANQAAADEREQHRSVVRACTQPNALHISLRMNYLGQFITRDGVISMDDLILGRPFADMQVGTVASRYYREMKYAIEKNTPKVAG